MCRFFFFFLHHWKRVLKNSVATALSKAAVTYPDRWCTTLSLSAISANSVCCSLSRYPLVYREFYGWGGGGCTTDDLHKNAMKANIFITRCMKLSTQCATRKIINEDCIMRNNCICSHQFTHEEMSPFQPMTAWGRLQWQISNHAGIYSHTYSGWHNILINFVYL